MSDIVDPAEAAARLEAALERIAALAERNPPGAPADPLPDTAHIAARLDSLITHLRTVLGQPVA